jgi:hypothetical protein
LGYPVADVPTGDDTGPQQRDSQRDSASSNAFARAAVPFRRRFFLPASVLGVAEFLLVG